MKIKKIFVFLTAVAVLLSPFSVFAMEARDIVEKSNRALYYQGDGGRSDVHMEITDSQGRVRERIMTILRKDITDGGEQKYYVYFYEPHDVKGMAYMVWKHPGEDDDRWLYLPALDLVRRVAASDKRSSFVGSHFAYEEISGRGTEEDTHSLIEETDTHYRIKSVPKDPGQVEFSYFETSVTKDDFIPEKAELYDKNGKLYKTIEALEVEEIEGYPTVVKMKATNINTGGNTVSEFKEVDYDIGLEEDIFSERYLRRPPRRYLRQ